MRRRQSAHILSDTLQHSYKKGGQDRLFSGVKRPFFYGLARNNRVFPKLSLLCVSKERPSPLPSPLPVHIKCKICQFETGWGTAWNENGFVWKEKRLGGALLLCTPDTSDGQARSERAELPEEATANSTGEYSFFFAKVFEQCVCT